MDKTLAGSPRSEGSGYWITLDPEASDNQVEPESILGPVLVHTLISDQEEMMMTLSKFAMTPDWGICWYTTRRGLLSQRTWTDWRNGQTGTVWNSARTNTKSCPRNEEPLDTVQAGDRLALQRRGGSTCFPQNIYNQEQIRNCIATVKSFSEHKIEKSLWRKKHSMLLYLFILSLLNFLAISPRYVWQITYCFFALELMFNILGLKVKIIRKSFSYKKTT